MQSRPPLPLGVRHFSEDDFSPICPGELLLGRISGYSVKYEAVDGVEGLSEMKDLSPRLDKINLLVERWWSNWLNTAFHVFAPRRKWQKEF